MALFKYKVSDPAGKVSEMLIEGDSQTDAVRRVQRRGLLPLEFLGEGAAVSVGRGRFSLRSRFDLLEFTDRLVPLIEANVPLERALGIVGEGIGDTATGEVVGDLRRGLHEGRKFSALIRDRSRIFPRLYASVVEAGEEAGALPTVMAELRRFLNESREFRAYIVSASIYPVFVLAASLTMIGILVAVVLPRFAAILDSTGQALPLSARLLLQLAALVRGFWWLALLLLAGAVALAMQVRREGVVRQRWDRLVLRLPLLGRMVLLTNLARLARTMAVLMRSGVHLLDTVAIANRVVTNDTLRQSISGVAAELRQGQRLSNALAQSRHVPPFMLRMIAVGEETGAVDAMLDRVADRYEADLKRLVRRTLSLFEPMVIVGLGIFVAAIVLTMFFTIMNIQSGF